MADFGNITITDRGKEALVYAQKGETFTITKIVLGDGELPPDMEPKKVTALYGPKSEVVPQVIDAVDPRDVELDERYSVLRVGGVYDNTENLEGFYWREFGLFAKTDTTGEVLYTYGNAGDKAEFIPPGEAGYLIQRALDFYITVTPDAHVELSIDSKFFVTEERLQHELADVKQWVADTAKAHEAATADKLAETRDFQVNLASEDPASFDGTADANPGVTGELPITHGGTGASTAEQARKNLGIENAGGNASEDTPGLMSPADKKKLDGIDTEKLSKLGELNIEQLNALVTLDVEKIKALCEVDADKLKSLLTTITGGAETQVLLANGTAKEITAMLQENVETVRTALGVVTKETDGLVPKLPENPEVEE